MTGMIRNEAFRLLQEPAVDSDVNATIPGFGPGFFFRKLRKQMRWPMRVVESPIGTEFATRLGYFNRGRFMKMQSILVSLTCAALFVSTTVRADEPVDALKTEKERISYTVGVESARNFKKQGFEFDAQMFLRGMDDGMSGQKTLITEREMKKILQAFQVKVRQSMAANRKAAADENRRKSTEFLEANKSKDGIVALTSGLQYKVLKDGNGRKPTEADIVLCEYRGTLLDGTEFDGTTPGKPATMKLSQLIPGWKEALKLMPVGSKWQLFVPPSMAYGEKGVGTDIGPNELLVFELELVDIK